MVVVVVMCQSSKFVARSMGICCVEVRAPKKCRASGISMNLTELHWHEATAGRSGLWPCDGDGEALKYLDATEGSQVEMRIRPEIRGKEPISKERRHIDDSRAQVGRCLTSNAVRDTDAASPGDP